MKFFKTIFLFIFVSISAFCQDFPEAAGINHVRIIGQGSIIEADISHVQSLEPVLPNRNYYWYTHHQINKTQGGYSGRLLDGIYREFYKNKNIKELGYYASGLQTGKCTSWNEDGYLQEIVEWKEGLKNGRYQKFEGQKVIESGTYRSGLLHGKVRFFSSNKLIEAKIFKNGEQLLKNDDKKAAVQ